MKFSFTSVSALAVLTAHACNASYVSKMPSNPQSLLLESMEWMDKYYDPEAGYLHWILGNSALQHETRSSSWYAVGLLARNQGCDVANAEKILRNLIGAQFKDPKDQW